LETRHKTQRQDEKGKSEERKEVEEIEKREAKELHITQRNKQLRQLLTLNKNQKPLLA